MSDDASTEYKVIPIEQPRGFTSLTFAASVGDEAHVAALLEADPKALTTKDELMCDPLCWAARNSRVGVVSYLLGKDADVQSKSFGGMRPLHHACHVYDEAVIKELLSKNADANAPDDAGNTPFHYAVRRGVLNLCQMLVDAKADVTAKNAAGMTPLHTACNSGQLSIVQYLLKLEADPNEADKQGNTALHVSARTGFKAIVQALLAAGAKSSGNRAGKTPSQVTNDSEIIKLLENN